MPTISTFYGIVIRMHVEIRAKHHSPHIHAEYQNDNAVYGMDAEIIEGELPVKQHRLVQAWILIHSDELKEMWNDLQEAKIVGKIEPLT